MASRALVEWFKTGEDPWMDQGDAIELLHSSHPRTIFVKSLRRHAALLDVGAGNGSLNTLKHWPKPERRDLKIYAYAMEKGEGFEACDGYEVGTWPDQKPKFNGMQFDGILASHFIEHIPEPVDFVAWCANRLASGGRLYIEWPSDNSVGLPPRQTFHANDIPIVISDFYDDHTHRKLPQRDGVLKAMTKKGLSIDQQGVISNPFIEQEVLAHFREGRRDEFMLQSAYWSKTKWAQYVIASKP